MELQIPTKGRIVMYTLNEVDAQSIKNRRVNSAGVFAGNPVDRGDEYPAIVVNVVPGTGLVNLKVFLDGNDDYWATSKAGSDEPQPGCWNWPKR